MDDLTITRLCAEAMGIALVEYKSGTLASPIVVLADTGAHPYDPLHDDARAMALVEKFHMQIWPEHERRLGETKLLGWYAYIFKHATVSSPDLNRAICECVAKLKQGEPK